MFIVITGYCYKRLFVIETLYAGLKLPSVLLLPKIPSSVECLNAIYELMKRLRKAVIKSACSQPGSISGKKVQCASVTRILQPASREGSNSTIVTSVVPSRARVDQVRTSDSR